MLFPALAVDVEELRDFQLAAERLHLHLRAVPGGAVKQEVELREAAEGTRVARSLRKDLHVLAVQLDLAAGGNLAVDPSVGDAARLGHFRSVFDVEGGFLNVELEVAERDVETFAAESLHGSPMPRSC